MAPRKFEPAGEFELRYYTLSKVVKLGTEEEAWEAANHFREAHPVDNAMRARGFTLIYRDDAVLLTYKVPQLHLEGAFEEEELLANAAREEEEAAGYLEVEASEEEEFQRLT